MFLLYVFEDIFRNRHALCRQLLKERRRSLFPVDVLRELAARLKRVDYGENRKRQRKSDQQRTIRRNQTHTHVGARSVIALSVVVRVGSVLRFARYRGVPFVPSVA